MDVRPCFFRANIHCSLKSIYLALWKAKYFKYSEVGKNNGRTSVERTDNQIFPRLQPSGWHLAWHRWNVKDFKYSEVGYD